MKAMCISLTHNGVRRDVFKIGHIYEVIEKSMNNFDMFYMVEVNGGQILSSKKRFKLISEIREENLNKLL